MNMAKVALYLEYIAFCIRKEHAPQSLSPSRPERQPIGGNMACEIPLTKQYLQKVIDEELGYHRDSLDGWSEPNGYLIPSEPDVDERVRVRDRLRVAIDVLERLKSRLCLEP